LIVTMNARPSSVLPELEALLSRIDVYELRPTAEELFAPAVAAPGRWPETFCSNW
jgi:hypothetical protein